MDDDSKIEPNAELDNVVALDPARAKQQKRYDKLKKAKPAKGSADWVELMQLGRKLSGRTGGKQKEPTKAEARDEKLKQLYPRALLVLEGQIDAYLGEEPIACPECGHELKRQRRQDPLVAQKAAMRIVDQVEGKAAQTIRQEETVVHEIRYVTAAAPPAGEETA